MSSLLKIWPQTKAITMATIAVISFQGFSPAFKASLNPSHDLIREAHAKELLGKFYAGSPMEKSQQTDVYTHIYLEMQKGLPQAYKPRAGQITKTLIREAIANDLDPMLVLAIVKTESKFNPLVVGLVGEIGLMQIRPTTAAEVAKKRNLEYYGAKTLEDPEMNIRIGTAFVSQLREKFNGHPNKYISAYNIGARKVRMMYSEKRKPSSYSSRVMKAYYGFYERNLSNTVAMDDTTLMAQQ